MSLSFQELFTFQLTGIIRQESESGGVDTMIFFSFSFPKTILLSASFITTMQVYMYRRVSAQQSFQISFLPKTDFPSAFRTVITLSMRKIAGFEPLNDLSFLFSRKSLDCFIFRLL